MFDSSWIILRRRCGLTGVLHEGGAQSIPGGEHGDRLAGLLEPDQVGGAQPLSQISGLPLLTLEATRTYAVQTPKLGQNRKAAATRDALNRRGLRVTNFQDSPSDLCDCR